MLTLTERQLRILQLLSEGMTQEEIGAVICRSTKTVELEVLHIRQNLGARNTIHAISIALVFKMIDGPKIG